MAHVFQSRLASAQRVVIIVGSVFVFCAQAQESTELEEITVLGSSPLSADEIDQRLPYQLQVFSSEDLQANHYNSIADLLDRRARGVHINHAQNNPLQPDVQLRGFSASPLLGAPQGIATYINGVRINEPFGDTVNWDLLGSSAIDSLALLSGANGAYGLNALGGSLLINSKTGFNAPGSQLAASAGSFGRNQVAFSRGDNQGPWGYFLALDGFEEEGWRNYSASQAYSGYGALSRRGDGLEWDLFAFIGDTELRGNGAIPEQLMRENRKAVFTHPDLTENKLRMLSSQLRLELNAKSSLRLNVFARGNRSDSFNGDGSEFEECGPPLTGLLCEDDADEAVADQSGNQVAESFNAINNLSERQQDSWGGTLEYYRPWQLAGQEHHSSFGVDFYRGETEFASAVEFAQLRADRSTTRSGRYDSEGFTLLDSQVQSAALYWIDRFAFSARDELSLSLRYDLSDVKTQDRSGETPALNGDHRFQGWNGGLGLRHQLSESTAVYGNLHQSSRSPTPVELACSHPDAPCTLPNTFLADPPLDQVVARNLELGFQQTLSAQSEWQLNAFASHINDDIVFQTTGGVSSNEGFFSNASDTRRVGISAQLEAGSDALRWLLQYSWLRATFEDDFLVSSPNHPLAIDERIPVSAGDRLPGLPEHSVTIASEWQLSQQLSWRWDAQYQSGVYLRGDEGNLDARTDSAVIVNTTVDYQPYQALTLFLSVNNVFDTEYESFGLYGEPDEVIPYLDEENSRFLSPNEPRGAWLGLRYTW